jgi:uncharacterized protein (DUF305 family)
MLFHKKFILAVLLGLALGDVALAQPMSGMTMHTPPGGRTPSGMMAAMDKMNQAMASAHETGDTDRDFVAMMIPHHQGAVDMARAELATGKDPELRRLATAIIAAQNREMLAMRAWQARHPAATPH